MRFYHNYHQKIFSKTWKPTNSNLNFHVTAGKIPAKSFKKQTSNRKVYIVYNIELHFSAYENRTQVNQN